MLTIMAGVSLERQINIAEPSPDSPCDAMRAILDDVRQPRLDCRPLCIRAYNSPKWPKMAKEVHADGGRIGPYYACTARDVSHCDCSK